MHPDDSVTIHNNPPITVSVKELVGIIAEHKKAQGLPTYSVEQEYSRIVDELARTGKSENGYNGSKIERV